MTPSTIELTPTATDHRIARLAALAIGLTLAEAALPSPLPGVKPGLANIVTLLALYQLGLGAAIWISLLRVFGGSLLLGSFLTPGFVLSLSGAIASLAALTLLRHLPGRLFGPVTLSLGAAFAHIGTQLVVVFLWLIPHEGVFYLTPLFATAAGIFGTVNGLIVARLLADVPPTRAGESPT